MAKADASPRNLNARLGLWIALAITLVLVGGVLAVVWRLTQNEKQPPGPSVGEQVPTAPAPDNTIRELQPGEAEAQPAPTAASREDENREARREKEAP